MEKMNEVFTFGTRVLCSLSRSTTSSFNVLMFKIRWIKTKVIGAFTNTGFAIMCEKACTVFSLIVYVNMSCVFSVSRIAAAFLKTHLKTCLLLV